jgi:hypothetical protein
VPRAARAVVLLRAEGGDVVSASLDPVEEHLVLVAERPVPVDLAVETAAFPAEAMERLGALLRHGVLVKADLAEG